MGIFSLAMVETITIKGEASIDEYGDTTYGPSRQIKCRIEPQSERIRNPDGIVIDVKDVIYSEQPIYKAEQVTLPDGSEHVVTSVSPSKAIGFNQMLYKAVL